MPAPACAGLGMPPGPVTTLNTYVAPTCVPYDPIFAPDDYHDRCDINGTSGAPIFSEHHCESCVIHTMLGFLTEQILFNTDALSKLPMRPAYDLQTGKGVRLTYCNK